MGGLNAYLVAKAAHSCANGLLYHIQAERPLASGLWPGMDQATRTCICGHLPS